MNHPAQSQRTMAFTLVELLVVVAIVAILAAILLSAVLKVKSATQRAACLSNLRQVGFALRMYADDNDDVLPILPVPNPYPNGIGAFYKELVKGYVGLSGPVSPDEKVFVCPADRSVSLDASHAFTSYTFNGFERVGPYYLTPERGYCLGAASDPAQAVLAAEYTAFFGNSWHARQATNHNNAMNVITFADGHSGNVRIYWNGNQEPRWYEPIAGYQYSWRLN